MNNRKILGLIGIVEFICSILLSFLINHQLPLAFLAGICMILAAYIWQKSRKWLGLTTIIFIIFAVCWFLFDRIIFFDLMQAMLIVNYVIVFSKSLAINQGKKISKIILMLLSVMLSFMMILVLNDAKIFGTWMQKDLMKSENSMNIPKKSTIKLENKYLLTDGIRYASKYPNSYLSVIRSKYINANKPTVIYVHGGGFVGGTAISGDPNASTKDDAMVKEYERIVDHGFNVVAINYALAPQYAHPIPVIQLTQAVRFLQNNAQKLNLNMKNVVLGGGSAGGHIAAEFTAIQVNPAYAKSVGIKPVIKAKYLKAQVLDSAALDVNRGSKTQRPNILTDYVFAQSLGAYTGQPAIGFNKKKVAVMNLLTSINSKIPPTFISDGNYGTFADQAQDYYHLLKKYGVKAEIYIPSARDGQAVHGYMVNDAQSKFAQIYNQHKYRFLKGVDKSFK